MRMHFNSDFLKLYSGSIRMASNKIWQVVRKIKGRYIFHRMYFAGLRNDSIVYIHMVFQCQLITEKSRSE